MEAENCIHLTRMYIAMCDFLISNNAMEGNALERNLVAKAVTLEMYASVVGQARRFIVFDQPLRALIYCPGMSYWDMSRVLETCHGALVSTLSAGVILESLLFTSVFDKLLLPVEENNGLMQEEQDDGPDKGCTDSEGSGDEEEQFIPSDGDNDGMGTSITTTVATRASAPLGDKVAVRQLPGVRLLVQHQKYLSVLVWSRFL